MKNARQTCWLSLGSSKILLGIFALAVASVANLAFAQSSVQYEIGESYLLLEASRKLQRNEITQVEFDQIQMDQTCQNPSARLQDRNRPWMLVWNTSTTPDEVSKVTIDLTEPGFEFGDGDVPGDGFAGLLSLLAPNSDAGVALDSASYGSGGTDRTALELSFSGLSQGLAAIFRVDLDKPGGIAMFPDFREAMLGADTGSGPGQLALITTDFSSGDSSVSAFARAGPLSHSGIRQGYHSQTMSMVIPSTIVPEPTSLVLLLAGLTGIATMRRYRRLG